MKKKRSNVWIWILGAAGAVGVVALASRRRGSPGGGTLGPPVEGGGVPAVTPHGHYGMHRAGPPAHAHQGVDLAARPGSHVLAVGDGVIVSADPGLGKIVRKLVLDEPATWESGQEPVAAVVYADLGQPLVEPGDRVRRGDPIALVAPAGFVHVAVKARRGGGETFFDPRLAGFAYRSTHTEAA
jgi:murein DD-endopeptidase MepM/ murein hydrolase activator NlpD